MFKSTLLNFWKVTVFTSRDIN